MVYYERNVLTALNKEIKDLEYFFSALSITGQIIDTETGEILTPSEFFKAETETQKTKQENEKSNCQQSRKRNHERKNRNR